FLETLKKEKEGNKNYGQRLPSLTRIRTHFSNDQETYFASIKPDENRVSTKLLATREIGDYWTEKPPKRNIHVIVEPPETIATSSREQELLDRIASLEASLNKSVYEFDVIIKPKQKANKWIANIEHATLKDLKEYIRGLYKSPALENDKAVLNFMNDERRYYPRNDVSFQEILRSLISKSNPKFTVFIETPSKPFNFWTFQKSAIKHLMAELDLRKKTTPLVLAYEATKSIYSYCYLASGVSLFENNFKIVLEKLVKGHNGQGNLDLAIECRSTRRIAGLVKVKRDDFKQGIAQATMQMESSLTCRKCKASEIDDEKKMDIVWGIVTDAEKWYFMECTFDKEKKPAFKLSKPVIVEYDDENLQAKVEKVLAYIVWLLDETQKLVEIF
ncbi:7858_t:CDS:2, partial [Funneliformis geosporum]